jgi:hypothetical protein
MSNNQSTSPLSKLVEWRRGLGEVFGFAVAGISAVFELLAGRWPGVSERRRLKRAALGASEEVIDRIAPYPIQEG